MGFPFFCARFSAHYFFESSLTRIEFALEGQCVG